MTAEEVLRVMETGIRLNARRLARRCPQSSLTADDLEQEARVAVLKAMPQYDPTRAKVVTYFPKRVYGAMLDALRDESFAPRLAVQRGEPLVKVVTFTAFNRCAYRTQDGEDPKGYGVYRIDPAHHDPEPADCTRVEFAALCRRLFDGLTAAERRVLVLYYCDGLTMKQIAGRLGVSESRVSQIHSAVLGRCRASDPREVAA